jgi:hypothetical protein
MVSDLGAVNGKELANVLEVFRNTDVGEIAVLVVLETVVLVVPKTMVLVVLENVANVVEVLFVLDRWPPQAIWGSSPPQGPQLVARDNLDTKSIQVILITGL